MSGNSSGAKTTYDPRGRATGIQHLGLRCDDDMQGRWTQSGPAERVVNPMQPSEAQPYNHARDPACQAPLR